MSTLTKYRDVEVGHWFRVKTGDWGPGSLLEVVGLEWLDGAGDAMVHLRADGGHRVHECTYQGWRQHVTPALPPWCID